ncbi:MAG: hypothetical protein FE78DRAFT_26568 [Acidomyces sp. 'richmondensis']|nr:MAG: hypothetical protein FE78DRAFT_26568 [Acidomyces sp. 'richmondensis']
MAPLLALHQVKRLPCRRMRQRSQGCAACARTITTSETEAGMTKRGAARRFCLGFSRRFGSSMTTDHRDGSVHGFAIGTDRRWSGRGQHVGRLTQQLTSEKALWPCVDDEGLLSDVLADDQTRRATAADTQTWVYLYGAMRCCAGAFAGMGDMGNIDDEDGVDGAAMPSPVSVILFVVVGAVQSLEAAKPARSLGSSLS